MLKPKTLFHALCALVILAGCTALPVDPDRVANRWASNMARYPFFTSFIENMLYAAYYAAAYDNGKLDQNAHGDLAIMTHLVRGDVIVSNEQKFLRTAFTDLWLPQGKRLLTSEEFAAELEKLLPRIGRSRQPDRVSLRGALQCEP